MSNESVADVLDDDREYVIAAWSVQATREQLGFAGSEGCCFRDFDGNRFLDFSSQVVNANIGHQHSQVTRAIRDQVDRFCVVGPQMTTDLRARLARRLAAVTPGNP